MSIKKKVLFLVLGIILVFLNTKLPATYPYPSWDYGNYSLHNTTHMALYNFNEGAGSSTRDDSGRGKTGIFFGIIPWVQEKDANLTQNATLDFGGSGQYVRVNNNADFNISSADVKGFVISAMIKVPDSCTKTYMMICSKYDYSAGPPVTATGFTLYLINGILRFTAYDGTSQANIQDPTGTDLRDGKWHFVAVEFFSGTYRLFIDPTETYNGQVNSFVSSIQPANNTKNFYIAHREHPLGWDNDKDFCGSMDCVYFYEIEPEDVFNPPHRMWGYNNEGYWSFDEGVGTPTNIINDLVRWTSYSAGYHSYGKFYGTGFNFLARANSWKGEHAAEFNNAQLMAYVEVPDPTNRLDFAANPNYEDLYIEFLFMLNNNISVQNPLIEKYDSTVANGYRIYYTGSSTTGTLYFQVARNGATGQVQTPSLTFGTGWKHVWAWAQNGVLHLIVKNESSGAIWQYTKPITCGIGASSSSLYFAYRPSAGYYYDGWMDEVVIGRLFPGLEY